MQFELILRRKQNRGPAKQKRDPHLRAAPALNVNQLLDRSVSAIIFSSYLDTA